MTQEHLQAISTNGRFPWVPGATFVGVHDTDVKVDENGVHVRLDDKAHDDFWMLMTIPPAPTRTLVSPARGCETTMAARRRRRRRGPGR